LVFCFLYLNSLIQCSINYSFNIFFTNFAIILSNGSSIKEVPPWRDWGQALILLLSTVMCRWLFIGC